MELSFVVFFWWSLVGLFHKPTSLLELATKIMQGILLITIGGACLEQSLVHLHNTFHPKCHPWVGPLETFIFPEMRRPTVVVLMEKEEKYDTRPD